MADHSKSGRRGRGMPRPPSDKPRPPPLPHAARHEPVVPAAQREPSAPEINVAYTAAGRETLAAIAEELAEQAAQARSQFEPVSTGPETREPPSSLPRAVRRPQLDTLDYGDRISNAPGGVRPPSSLQHQPPPPPKRSTSPRIAESDAPREPPSSRPQPPPLPRRSDRPPELSSVVNAVKPPHLAIDQPSTVTIAEAEDDVLAGLDLESEAPTAVRPRRRTHDFADRPRIRDTAPEVITIEERPAGRETLSAIAEEIARDNADVRFSDPGVSGSIPDGVLPQASMARGHAESELEVLEMATFVVRGDELGRLSSEAARRDFVVERLMHRLPVQSLEDVDRIDVTPWTVRGTVIVRVWCRVRDPGA